MNANTHISGINELDVYCTGSVMPVFVPSLKKATSAAGVLDAPISQSIMSHHAFLLVLSKAPIEKKVFNSYFIFLPFNKNWLLQVQKLSQL